MQTLLPRHFFQHEASSWTCVRRAVGWLTAWNGELLSFSCHADVGRKCNSSRLYDISYYSEDVEHNFAMGLFYLLFPQRICLKYD